MSWLLLACLAWLIATLFLLADAIRDARKLSHEFGKLAEPHIAPPAEHQPAGVRPH